MSKRPFTPYSERFGAAAPTMWLIDELWEQQEQRTRDILGPSNVTHIDTAREKRRG